MLWLSLECQGVTRPSLFNDKQRKPKVELYFTDEWVCSAEENVKDKGKTFGP